MTDPSIAVPTDPIVPPTPVRIIDTGAPTAGAVTVTNALLIAALRGTSGMPKVIITPAVSHRADAPVVQAAVTADGGLIQYETSSELLHDHAPVL
jgi:hypothetical protein